MLLLLYLKMEDSTKTKKEFDDEIKEKLKDHPIFYLQELILKENVKENGKSINQKSNRRSC